MARFPHWMIFPALISTLTWFTLPLARPAMALNGMDAEIEVTPTTFEIIHDTAPQTSTRVLTIQNLGDGFLHWSSSESTDSCSSSSDVGWISTVRDSGTVNPQSQDDVPYTIDSTGLSDGVYSAELCLSSNDPDEPLIKIAVQLTVGAPAPLDFHQFLPLTRRR